MHAHTDARERHFTFTDAPIKDDGKQLLQKNKSAILFLK